MVHSAVGVRCPDCAQTKRPPTFDVSGIILARAIGASLGLGLLSGVAVKILSLFLSGIPLVVAFAALGYAIGEGVSRSVNRKRGRRLKLVASTGVLVAFVVSALPFGGPSVGSAGLLGLLIAVYISISRF